MQLKLLIFILLLAQYSVALGQFVVRIQLQYGDSNLLLNHPYRATKDTIEINTLKFYISNITLLNDQQVVFSDEHSYKLVDAENEHSLLILLNCKPDLKFNALKFDVGIDSATNYGGALGGDLDPTRGMYWTWQNGYINFKLEGKSTLSTARNNEFQYHIGGYNAPYATLQTVNLPVVHNREIVIKADIEKLLTYINKATIHHIMSPGDEAVNIANNFPAIFSIAK